MTKKQESMLNSYEWALRYYGRRTLYDAYKSCSYEKQRAYDYCLNLESELNGYDGSVVGASVFFFSYAFKYMDNENREHLMYITHANDYDFVIQED